MNIKNEKIIVHVLEENKIISIKKYKSMKKIHDDYPNIPYNNLRGIYLYHKRVLNEKNIPNLTKKENKIGKGLHVANTFLIKKLLIFDNPEFLETFKEIVV